jgi:hypothetical protein
MKTCRSFFSLIALSTALAAQSVPEPKLEVQFVPLHMKFLVTGTPDPFVGAVIVSLSRDLVLYSPALPKLLSDFAVVGIGVSSLGGVYGCSIDEHVFPPGMFIYAQGVTFDGSVFRATAVHEFVLDVTVPNGSK